jgi:hypothetical protein
MEVIVQAIGPQLLRYISKYDEAKYPPAELSRLRSVFSGSGSDVREDDITAALVWKYGHTGKSNFPTCQRALAFRIADLWHENAIVPTKDPEKDFYRWRALLGQTSFITVCFLLHLVHPHAIPILDQHNYRAVNYYLSLIHPAMKKKAKPSQFEDLLLIRDFSACVLTDWENHCKSKKPAPDSLDRFLMMYGKNLKTRGT